jgi:protease-4
MAFAKLVWRLLVGIKDALVLLAMLAFFGGLYAAMSVRPALPQVKEGALVIDFKGAIVEELPKADLESLLSGDGDTPQLRERDVLRALKGAAKDSKIKAVVLDFSKFSGAGFVHASEIGAAIDEVRAAKKPVLAFGAMYDNAGLLMASHASEIWVDPLGGAYVEGMGGQRLYYGKLLEKLKITAHVFRVGTYKDYVEPYLRDGMSDPSREANKALLGSIFGQWRDNIVKARPKAQVDKVAADPVGWFKAAGGDAAKAALNAGFVDKIGNHAEFGAAVAKIVGKDSQDTQPGGYSHTPMGTWLAANPASTNGKAIGVVTIAGAITDGTAGPGSAGGERIVKLIDSAEKKDLAALVIRVDSPGGSVVGSEAIRAAILRQKARGLPVVVSMANMAASGGYWVSTPGSRIFAEPGTITGSIGIFAVIPSFERVLADWGVKGDGVRTGPLAGQPDVLTGFTPEIEQVLQANIEAGYSRFINLVAQSRHKTPAQVDAIAQGRVWDGGTARQIGLVDQFGGLDDALAYAAKEAKLDPDGWHAAFLGEDAGTLRQVVDQFRQDGDDASEDDDSAMGHDWAGMIAMRQRQQLGMAVNDTLHMLGSGGAQAYCLECMGNASGLVSPRPAVTGQQGWMVKIIRWIAG